MGFSAGNYAKIKEVVEKKDNSTVCKITITKKNRLSNEYELQFMANCRFVGNAHKSVPHAEQRIKIKACDVTNCYVDSQGDLQFTKSPQYVIFDYELQEAISSTSKPTYASYGSSINFEDLSSLDSDIPF